MAHTGFMLNEGHFDSAAVSALLQLPDFSAMQVLNELASVPSIAMVSQGWGVGCGCSFVHGQAGRGQAGLHASHESPSPLSTQSLSMLLPLLLCCPCCSCQLVLLSTSC